MIKQRERVGIQDGERAANGGGFTAQVEREDSFSQNAQRQSSHLRNHIQDGTMCCLVAPPFQKRLHRFNNLAANNAQVAAPKCRLFQPPQPPPGLPFGCQHTLPYKALEDGVLMWLFPKNCCLLLEYGEYMVRMIQEIGGAKGQWQAHNISVLARHLQKKLKRIALHRLGGCPRAGWPWRLSARLESSGSGRWGTALHESRPPFQKREAFHQNA